MAWPNDTLSTANTDQGTDKPHLARPDINAVTLMVQSILGEAPAGSLLLTNQDEGPGNGLDADTVDGEHASAFANAAHNHDAGNITTGTLPMTRGGTGRNTAFVEGAVVVGAGVSLVGVNTVTGGLWLKSQVGTLPPVWSALPTFPTVDVHASDFVVVDANLVTVSSSGTVTVNTGFGTDDFTWGFGGVKRSDGSTALIRLIGTDDNDLKQTMSTDNTLSAPIEPAVAAAGQINIAAVTSTAGTIGWTVRIWARKNI